MLNNAINILENKLKELKQLSNASEGGTYYNKIQSLEYALEILKSNHDKDLDNIYREYLSKL